MIMIIVGIALGVCMLLGVLSVPVYIQYYKHKAPLKAVDPNVHYGFFHHIAIVTIPIIRYRLSRKRSRRSTTPPVISPDRPA